MNVFVKTIQTYAQNILYISYTTYQNIKFINKFFSLLDLYIMCGNIVAKQLWSLGFYIYF